MPTSSSPLALLGIEDESTMGGKAASPHRTQAALYDDAPFGLVPATLASPGLWPSDTHAPALFGAT